MSEDSVKKNEYSESEEFTTKAQKPKKGRKSKKSNGRWTIKEHELFIEGVKKYGNNWKMLESLIKTRNAVQIRSHAQKFFNRIKEEFNTEEPLKYVCENSCEEFQLYRFDNFKQSSDPKGLSNKALELNNMNKEGCLDNNIPNCLEFQFKTNENNNLFYVEECYQNKIEENKGMQIEADFNESRIPLSTKRRENYSEDRLNELSQILDNYTLDEIVKAIMRSSKHQSSISSLSNSLFSHEFLSKAKVFCECNPIQQSSIIIHKPVALMPILPRQMKINPQIKKHQ